MEKDIEELNNEFHEFLTKFCFEQWKKVFENVSIIDSILRPEGARNVNALEILQECVKQNTHRPDIMSLELKNY
jgi:hypothetical protein